MSAIQAIRQAEIGIFERFVCDHCGAGLYARVSIIYRNDLPSLYNMPPRLTCWQCKGITDSTEQLIDKDVHYGFICDVCGEESSHTVDEAPSNEVSCCHCGAIHEVNIIAEISQYWKGKKA